MRYVYKTKSNVIIYKCNFTLMKKLIQILFLLSSFATMANAQQQPQSSLTDTPNFLKKQLKATDSLFIQDINILKNHISFAQIDSAILKPNLLYFLLSEKATDTLLNYQTLINTVKKFKEDIGYKELVKGIVLYKEMQALKVNPKNWEHDQHLFRKLGFTEADLEDFLSFIAKPENANLTYKEAYLAYMKEIENL